MDTSPAVINIPEDTCTIEDSEDETRPVQSPVITSPARQHTEAADKSTEIIEPATMNKLDKILSYPRCNSMEKKFCHNNNYNVYIRSEHIPSDKVCHQEPRKLQEATSTVYKERTRVFSLSSLTGENAVPPTMLAPWNSPITETIPPVPSTSSTRLSPLNSGGNNTSLRKHSRGLNLHDEKNNDEKCLRLTKTLRVFIDPQEAAKSCIWTTLGIKSGKTDPVRNGCMFRAFQFMPEVNAEASEVDKALEANPIALSRSQKFRERN